MSELEERVARIEDELGIEQEDDELILRFTDSCDDSINIPITEDFDIVAFEDAAGVCTEMQYTDEDGYLSMWGAGNVDDTDKKFVWKFEQVEIVNND